MYLNFKDFFLFFRAIQSLNFKIILFLYNFNTVRKKYALWRPKECYAMVSNGGDDHILLNR